MSDFYYADSSALIKRHVPEIGSSWIISEFEATSGNTVISSKLSIAEVLSGMNRRRREKSITKSDYDRFSKDFAAVSRFQYSLIDLTDNVFQQTQRLLEEHALRAGDAIQLASAYLANAELASAGFPELIFLASDAKLLEAAQSESLLTDDPLNHP